MTRRRQARRATDDPPRPAAGWLRQGATHLVGLALAAAFAAATVHLVPEPLTDRLIGAEQRGEAEALQARLLRRLVAGAETFADARVLPEDREVLWSAVLASDLRVVTLRDAAGRAFWSTDTTLVGTRGAEAGPTAAALATTDYEAHHVAAGDPAPGDGPRDVIMGLVAAPRVIAVTRRPVLAEGVVGLMEFHRDVTRLHDAFTGHLRVILLIVAAGALAMQAGSSLVLVRAGLVEGREAAARAAREGALAREVRLLSDLNGWLQSCRTLDELFVMVARFMGHILPGSEGSLYVYSNSRDVLDGAASWNGGRHHDHIRPEECWGLRRGRAYAYGEGEVDFPCGHAHEASDDAAEAAARSVCTPILAHGETVGLMTVTARAGSHPGAFEEERRLAQMAAEQVSVAIANVRMRDALQHQAIRDPLTGLFNQRHLLEQLRRHVESRATHDVGVVSLDVDHFKRFNDNFGHDAGDMVLRAVGEALGRHAEGDDLACRVGGEEFVLLLPGLTAAQTVERAERARQDVAEIVVRYGDRALPRVTVSVGVAHCPTHGTMPQEVVRAADDALYAAKARGRDCVVMAGPGAERAAPAADWACDLADDLAPGGAPLRAELRRA